MRYPSAAYCTDFPETLLMRAGTTTIRRIREVNFLEGHLHPAEVVFVVIVKIAALVGFFMHSVPQQRQVRERFDALQRPTQHAHIATSVAIWVVCGAPGCLSALWTGSDT